MNTDILQGNWNEIRGKLKARWGQLTDDNLTEFGGDVEQLIGRLQQRTGETREAIEGYLDELAAGSSSPRLAQAAERARHYAGYAAQQVHAASEGVVQQLQASYTGAGEMVRRRPTESLAVAFGTGLIAGVILGLVLRPRS